MTAYRVSGIHSDRSNSQVMDDRPSSAMPTRPQRTPMNPKARKI